MFARFATRGSRSMVVGRRNFFSQMYEYPNTIKQQAKEINPTPKIVGADNPTYLKAGMADNVVTGFVYALTGAGILMAGKGLFYDIANGKSEF